MKRTDLETMTKEQLIEVILDTWEGGALREQDAAGTEKALEMETQQADSIATQLAETDAVIWTLACTGKADTTYLSEAQRQHFAAAMDRASQRRRFAEDRAARAAKKAKEA